MQSSGTEEPEVGAARYEMKLAGVGATVALVGWLLYVAYGYFVQRRWAGDLGDVGLLLVLCATLYGNARARLAERRKRKSAAPGQLSAATRGRR